MSAIEGELEILLGELHIKMKGENIISSTMSRSKSSDFHDLPNTFSLAGLIGFARLCPGDQYEVSFCETPQKDENWRKGLNFSM